MAQRQGTSVKKGVPPFAPRIYGTERRVEVKKLGGEG